jgi:hypothetical protein
MFGYSQATSMAKGTTGEASAEVRIGVLIQERTRARTVSCHRRCQRTQRVQFCGWLRHSHRRTRGKNRPVKKAPSWDTLLAMATV